MSCFAASVRGASALASTIMKLENSIFSTVGARKALVEPLSRLLRALIKLRAHVVDGVHVRETRELAPGREEQKRVLLRVHREAVDERVAGSA